MKLLFSFLVAGCLVIVMNACNSSSKDKATTASFCDTTCNNDTMHFESGAKDRSFVTITMKNCKPDSVTWGSEKMITYRQLPFTDLVGKTLPINKNFVRAKIFDGYVWLLMNECISGQGYVVKLPFNDKENIFRKNTAFNPMDKKYTIDESIIAHTDKGNLFMEQMATGKKAMMTFGEPLAMEYNDMHQAIDSISITPTHAWAKVKIGKEWKVVEKDIVFE
jgi:hypothetical protein